LLHDGSCPLFVEVLAGRERSSRVPDLYHRQAALEASPQTALFGVENGVNSDVRTRIPLP
jgi:hypothetical protein